MLRLDLPAQTAGLLPKDVLVLVDNVKVNSTVDLRAILDNKTAGDTLNVTVLRGENWQYQFSTIVNLTVSENRTVMGIMSSEFDDSCKIRQLQNLLP